MDWTGELSRFAVHAAAAAALVVSVLGPARALIARLGGAVGRIPRRWFIALAMALTLGVRLALLPAVHPVYEADIKEYVEKAATIARDGNPRAQETRPDGSHFYRTLGYSLPLAGWYRVTGVPETPEGRVRSAQYFNLLTAAAIAALIVALGVAAGNEPAGRLAALVYATFLPAAMFSLLPYSETWTTLTLVASLVLFERLRSGEDRGAVRVALAAGLGAAQGLLLITRFEFVWMPALLAMLLVVAKRRGAVLLAAVSLVAAVVPLAVNREMRDGYPGELRTSVQGGLILYFGNNPIEVNGYGNATPEVAAHVRELYATDPTGGLARDEAVAWMKSNPLLVVANAPKKLYHLWLAEPQGFTWHVQAGREPGTNSALAATLRHAAWAQSLALLALGVAGLVAGCCARPAWIWTIALHAAVWCLLAASTRNRYPLEPLLMVAACAWLQSRAPRAPRD